MVHHFFRAKAAQRFWRLCAAFVLPLVLCLVLAPSALAATHAEARSVGGPYITQPDPCIFVRFYSLGAISPNTAEYGLTLFNDCGFPARNVSVWYSTQQLNCNAVGMGNTYGSFGAPNMATGGGRKHDPLSEQLLHSVPKREDCGLPVVLPRGGHHPGARLLRSHPGGDGEQGSSGRDGLHPQQRR